MTADEIIAKGVPLSHMPRQDYDYQSVRVGHTDADHELRIPPTDFNLSRGVCLEAKDENPGGWTHADLEIAMAGMRVNLGGLNAADLKDLSDFFAEYAQRLRQW
jgi:hypothetical protein